MGTSESSGSGIDGCETIEDGKDGNNGKDIEPEVSNNKANQGYLEFAGA